MTTNYAKQMTINYAKQITTNYYFITKEVHISFNASITIDPITNLQIN